MHDIDMSNGRANIAFVGDRNDIWHRLGDQMQPGESIDTWRKRAGLDWTADIVPAGAMIGGTWRTVENANFICRSDTGAVISPSSLSDQYKPVQPAELLAWFGDYIGVDDRFALDVAGSLKGGSTIWATATYRDPLSVAGEKHEARILMTTTFDGSGATKNKATMTRTVCRNTLNVALGDKRAEITTRHNTRFDARRVGAELAALAQGFAQFKVIGDAMAQVNMSKEEVSRFFKELLDIPFEAKREDVSTRKMNQFADLNRTYRTSVAEGAPQDSVWAALQSITRYVDHERSSRGGDTVSVDEARFTSAQFGSGAALKGKAMQLLMPRIKDRVPVLAA